MNFVNIIMARQIFDFVNSRPLCSIPDVKDHLNIPTGRPPTPEEKRIYDIINQLHAEGFIKKTPPKFYYPGGPRFVLSPTSFGEAEFSKLCVKGQKLVVNSQEIKSKHIEFSEENKFILEDLSERIFELIPKGTKVNEEKIHTLLEDIRRQQDNLVVRTYE